MEALFSWNDISIANWGHLFRAAPCLGFYKHEVPRALLVNGASPCSPDNLFSSQGYFSCEGLGCAEDGGTRDSFSLQISEEGTLLPKVPEGKPRGGTVSIWCKEDVPKCFLVPSCCSVGKGSGDFLYHPRVAVWTRSGECIAHRQWHFHW